ncbi:PQQ-dependent sugar dehydrogenase [Rhizobacter sp. OV335]|uniref:PQQ-dependent sugar dehydrogenase n=1 Tax=Rhizobacter sp. OV335 TaxID=1500264 RepID=UPI00091BE72D|nr:Glucose/arabinose dehydrogenase, beta-propeller fold [Rhizobacter sp. OV335]
MNAMIRAALVAMTCAVACTAQAVDVASVASGLQNPWGLAFLPDGRMLVTERPGRMRIVTADGRLGEPLQGLPAVDARSQGGLLDVALDPKFASNGLVYWSYAEAGSRSESDKNGTAVARGRLQGDRLTEVSVIFRQLPKVKSTAHFGSRLVFGRDGRLFITLGDRYLMRDDAQNLGNHLGKVVRIEADGRVPADNPYVKTAGARPELWSIGHRNMQGAALNPWTGALWTHEHGPQGGDEVNLDGAGKNYGWPVITYGCEYGSCAAIGEGKAKAGMEQPLTYWVPSIAPSGMAFLTSERYAGWKGSLFVGALAGQMLVRLQLDGDKIVKEERLLTELHERIRDVRQGPDGFLYLLTDNNPGRVLRVVP